MGDISEIWVLQQGGNCLYNYSVDESIDADLFANFVTAIDNFSHGMSKDGIKTLGLAGYKLVFTRDNDLDLMFIARTNPKVKNKGVFKKINVIKEKFKGKFTPSFIAGCDGSPNYFQAFSEDVQSYLKIKAKKQG